MKKHNYMVCNDLKRDHIDPIIKRFRIKDGLTPRYVYSYINNGGYAETLLREINNNIIDDQKTYYYFLSMVER